MFTESEMEEPISKSVCIGIRKDTTLSKKCKKWYNIYGLYIQIIFNSTYIRYTLSKGKGGRKKKGTHPYSNFYLELLPAESFL